MLYPSPPLHEHILIIHHHHHHHLHHSTSFKYPKHASNTPTSPPLSKIKIKKQNKTKMESSCCETEKKSNKKKKKSISNYHERRKCKVALEGYIESVDGFSDQGSENGGGGSGSNVVGRTKSLTDEDLDELKGCLDLGFGFRYDEIPELCSTLPALELCYSMSQRFLDEKRRFSDSSSEDSVSLASTAAASSSSTLVANWKISSPGDDPDEVKARLRYWAQAVACTIQLCR